MKITTMTKNTSLWSLLIVSLNLCLLSAPVQAQGKSQSVVLPSVAAAVKVASRPAPPVKIALPDKVALPDKPALPDKATPAPFDQTTSVFVSIVENSKTETAYENLDDAAFKMIAKYAPCVDSDTCLDVHIKRYNKPDSSPGKTEFFYGLHFVQIVLGNKPADDKIVEGRRMISAANAAFFDEYYQKLRNVSGIRLDLGALSKGQHVMKITMGGQWQRFKKLLHRYDNGNDEGQDDHGGEDD